MDIKTKNSNRRRGSNDNEADYDLFKWFVVLGSFIVYFIADGVSLSFGIFTREFIAHFNARDSVGFLTSGLIQAVPLFLSPLVCLIIKRYNCRVVAAIGAILLSASFILARLFADSLIMLNITIGLICSAGLAFSYIPAYLIISFYFVENRVFATGLAVSGSGVGLFFLSPVLELLIEHYGWLDACFIFGAITSHTFISACLFRTKNTEEKDDVSDNVSDITIKYAVLKSFWRSIKKIYSNRQFLIVSLSYFLLSFCIMSPYNFLPSHLKFISIDDPSSIHISLIGISTVVGQVVIGFLSDKFKDHHWLIFSICLMSAGVVTCLVPLLNSIALIYCYSIVFGFASSVNYLLQSSLVIASLGLDDLTVAFGCLQMSQGFTTLIGMPFLGWIREITNSYNSSFITSGFVICSAGIVMLVWPLVKHKQ
jgi:MFS family permease